MATDKPTVVVVDGKPVSRKFYTKMLRQFFGDQYVIYEAESGIKGVILCDKRQISCALAAFELPDFDGLAFLDQLKTRLGKDRSVPTIIIAKDQDEQKAIQAMKLGAHDYLIKGKFSPVSLAQSVKHAVENSLLNRELVKSREQLLEAVHQAGMAEIATGILHNIGNNLNSVTTALHTIMDTLQQSKIKGLTKANKLLVSMEETLATHPKGLKLIDYYQSLDEMRDKEFAILEKETSFLLEKIGLIRNDVNAQTRYAGSEFFVEEVEPKKLVEDVLLMMKKELDDKGITIHKVYNKLPNVRLVRVKFIQIINNLIKNSIDALKSREDGPTTIVLGIRPEGMNSYAVYVRDGGIGIAPEDIENIFNYGFTTKEDSLGIGLHAAANAATEMGGTLTAESPGINQGAVFTATFPLDWKGQPGSTEKDEDSE